MSGHVEDTSHVTVDPTPEAEFENMAAEINNTFEGVGVSVDTNVVLEEIRRVYEERGLTPSQTREYVTQLLRFKHNIPASVYNGSTPTNDRTTLSDIDTGGELVRVIGEVVNVWSVEETPNRQMGVIEDDTSSVSFVGRGGIPSLEDGEAYIFDNAITSTYNDNQELIFDENTTITPYTHADSSVPDVEFGDYTAVEAFDHPVTYTWGDYTERTNPHHGEIVNLEDDGGVLERCSVVGCLNHLDNGECEYHGYRERGGRVVTLRCVITIIDDVGSKEAYLNSKLIAALLESHPEDMKKQYFDARENNPDATPIRDELKGLLLHEEVSLEVEPGTELVGEIAFMTTC
jgi:hypothetical protein